MTYEATIRAPRDLLAVMSAENPTRKSADGTYTFKMPQPIPSYLMALAVGDRALLTRPVMSFIVTDDVTIVGFFPPNGFHTIKPGAPVKLVFDQDPGTIHHATLTDIQHGVGQGQVAVSGMLARVGSIGGANAYPAEISLPQDMDRAKLRLGMPGTATMFADNAGVIGLLMSILVWISSYTAYL